MGNRIGTSRVFDGRTYIELGTRHYLTDVLEMVDAPKHLKGIPPGMVIYIDRDGKVQAMEEP